MESLPFCAAFLQKHRDRMGLNIFQLGLSCNTFAKPSQVDDSFHQFWRRPQYRVHHCLKQRCYCCRLPSQGKPIRKPWLHTASSSACLLASFSKATWCELRVHASDSFIDFYIALDSYQSASNWAQIRSMTPFLTPRKIMLERAKQCKTSIPGDNDVHQRTGCPCYIQQLALCSHTWATCANPSPFIWRGDEIARLYQAL